MPDCKIYSVDSSVVGLSYAIEECPAALPTTGVEWTRLEPSEFSDFGATLTVGTRSAGGIVRRTQKGSITGVSASAGFTQDLTTTNHSDVLMSLALRTTPQLRARQGITSITANTINVTSGGVFSAGDIVAIRGDAIASNNATLVVVASVSGNAVNVTPLRPGTALSPSGSGGYLHAVGRRFAAGELGMGATANSAAINRSTGNVNLGQVLGLQPGDWIFVGGDTPASNFGSDNKPGFARVSQVATNYLSLDRTTWEPKGDTGAGKQIEIYYARRVRDPVTSSELAQRTVQFERTLGKTANNDAAEYILGAGLDELSISMPADSSVTMEAKFTAVDATVQDGTQPLKAGTRRTVPKTSPFSTATDTVRTYITRNDSQRLFGTGMFEYVTDVSFQVSNNMTRPPAHRVAGAQYGGLGVSAGTLEVKGSITAYYANAGAVQAVREGVGVSVDSIMTREGMGLVIDLPLVTLSNAQITVQESQPITLPLTLTAAESERGYMMGTYWFDGLPQAARG